MAGVFQKAKVWLGLAPDDEYDDYGYGYDEPRPAPGPQQRPAPGPSRPAAPQRPRPVPDDYYDEPAAPARPTARPSGAVRTLPARNEPQRRPTSMPETPTVRPMRPTSAKPTVIAPAGFDQAKDIADRFKADQPVVMDLRDADRELARRLIDFSSGICYALGGHMEKVAAGTYLITPANVDVSDVEKRRLRERP